MNRVVLRFFFVLCLCAPNVVAAMGNPSTRNPSTRVNLAVGIGDTDLLFQIAVDQDFFTDHRVDVSLHTYKRGVEEIRQGILHDGMDGAIVPALVTAVESFANPGLFSVVAEIGSIDASDTIIARADRGITSPLGLAGKKIGVPKGGTAHYFLATYLEKWDIPLKEVTLVFMKKKKLSEAILKGEIDAVCQHEPVMAKIRTALHGNFVEFKESTLTRKMPTLVMRNDFTKKHPELVEGIVRGILDAWTFLREHRDESEKIIAKRKHSSIEEVRHYLNAIYSVHIGLSQSILIKMEQGSLWAIRSGLVDARDAPNALDLVDYSIMHNVRPDFVTIIH